MSAGANVLIICCLLQGLVCQKWEVFMPETVRGLFGSCVRIPCRFTLPSELEPYLDESCKAIWKKGWHETVVFDSSLTGEDAKLNTQQGELIGDLRKKKCTTIFYNPPFHGYQYYYFRLECDHERTKFNFGKHVYINMEESLPRPSLIPSSLEVDEDTPVQLVCTAIAPCPSSPPSLIWTPHLNDAVEKMATKSITSELNFMASYHHHLQEISCAVTYMREAGNSNVSYQSSLTVSVRYSPKATSISYTGPVLEGSEVTLTCSTNANPSVSSPAWYQVDGADASFQGRYWQLQAKASAEKNQFYCTVSNLLGTQSSPITKIDVQFAPKETLVTIEPTGSVLEGTLVTLTCSNKANPNVTDYAWYRDAQDIGWSGAALVLDRVDHSQLGEYKCEARNMHGAGISSTVHLDVHYPPKNVTIVVDPSSPLPAGSSVTLTCKAKANPAAETFIWYQAAGDQEEHIVGSQGEFTFNASKLSADIYRCKAKNIHGLGYSAPVSINATFAPEVLPTSTCAWFAPELRCSCESLGNPPPSVQWQLHDQYMDLSTSEEELIGGRGVRSSFTLTVEDTDLPSIVCFSTNSLGSVSLRLNVSLSDVKTELHTLTIATGSAAGVLGLLLLCAALLLLISRGKRHFHAPEKVVDSSSLQAANGCAPVQTEAIYATASIVEDDTLHYADISFAKFQARSDGEPGDRGVRGLDSRTAEYAEICLRSRRGSTREETDEAVVAVEGDQVTE